MTRILNQIDVKEKFFNMGLQIVNGPPRDLTSLMTADTAKLGKVIKEAGIRDE